jgi:AcrR family transcriptional regulator
MPVCLEHPEVREAILDAAGRLFERFGYKKTTVDEIAHEAGIGKATIYVYFPSKAETALSWIDRSNDRLLQELRDIAQSEDSPADRLRLMLHRRVMARFDRVQHFAQSFDELFAPVRSALLLKRDQNDHREAGALAEVIAEGVSRGLFSCEDASAAGYHLVLATNALLPYSLSADRLSDRATVEGNILQIAHWLLYGLTRRKDLGIRGDQS